MIDMVDVEGKSPILVIVAMLVVVGVSIYSICKKTYNTANTIKSIAEMIQTLNKSN